MQPLQAHCQPNTTHCLHELHGQHTLESPFSWETAPLPTCPAALQQYRHGVPFRHHQQPRPEVY